LDKLVAEKFAGDSTKEDEDEMGNGILTPYTM
jgi:hypothetical protein